MSQVVGLRRHSLALCLIAGLALLLGISEWNGITSITMIGHEGAAWLVNGFIVAGLVASRYWAIAKLQAEQTLLLDSARQLAKSEARYRLLAENASDMMVVLDLQFVRRYVSPSSQALTGYTPEELMAQAPELMLHPDDTTHIQATFRDLVASPGSAKECVTYRLLHRDGHWIWVEARIAVLDLVGAQREICATLRDITRRVTSEIALRESEERYHLLLQSGGVTEAIYMLDANGHVESWNAGAERIKGYTPAEIIGRHFSVFFTPEDVASGAPERALGIARNCGQFATEAWRIRKDGSRFLARVVLDAVRKDDGTLRGFAKVTHDITNQRIEEEQLEIIVEAAPNGMIIISEAGIITLANSQMERLFGYPRDELVGLAIKRLVPDGFGVVAGGELGSTFTKARSNRTTATARECIGRKRDGSEVAIEIMLSPVGTPRGRIVVAALFDVTDRKRRAAQQQAAERAAYQHTLEVTNARLDRLSKRLTKARDRAEQANQAKSRFLAGITHELRTPLHGILGYAELLILEGGLNPVQSERLEIMMVLGQHLLSTINAVLDMSQIEADQIKLKPIEINLLELVRVCLDVVRPAAEAKQLALVLAPQAPLCLVVDPTRLRQVLINLLGNAIKFTPAGAVEVRLRPMEAEGCIHLEVADTGPGIRAQHRDKLFQIFERLNAEAVSGIEGTGLGLALAARLVRLMNGRIGYADNPGGGSVFWLELPWSAAGTSGKSEAAPPSGQIVMQRLRVLVADDEALNRSIATGFLSNAGHEVVCVNDGAAAVEAAAATDFDVILMDVRMPGMNGLEATRRIRVLPSPRGKVRVIAVTAQAFAQQIEICRQAGMDSHVSKPFTQTALLASLQNKEIAPLVPALAAPLTSATIDVEPSFAVFDRAMFEDSVEALTAAELEEHLQTLITRSEALLCGLRRPGQKTEDLVEDAHRFAGGAGIFGFLAVAAAARQFELVVNSNRPDTAAFADQLAAAISKSMPTLQELLDTAATST